MEDASLKKRYCVKARQKTEMRTKAPVKKYTSMRLE
jgi:hypothetical protein